MQAIHINLVIIKGSIWVDGLELDSEVITDMMSELVPQNARRSWIAMEKDEGEERSER
jgi:hypothetical protein